MTPQLQQAIKLLQLSNMELAEFVEAEIERNPLLKAGEGEDANDATPDVSATERDSLKLDENSGLNEAREALDAPSEDVFESGTGSDLPSLAAAASGPSAQTDWSGVGAGASGEDFDFEGVARRETSLRDHLRNQLNLANLDPADRLIAARLIDETDDGGYCRTDLCEVSDALGADEASVARILEFCQGFDPTGVMARSLPECLRLQLIERDRYDPAMAAMVEQLDLVARFDLRALSEACGVDQNDIRDMI